MKHEPATVPLPLSRRDLLKRGVAVSAAAAWTVPIIQVVSMTPAHADTPSAPNVPPPTNPLPPTGTPPPRPPTTPPVTASTLPVPDDAPSSPPHATSAPKTPDAAAPPDALASTGPALPISPMLGAGVAAIALGGAAVYAAKRRDDEPEEQ